MGRDFFVCSFLFLFFVMKYQSDTFALAIDHDGILAFKSVWRQMKCPRGSYLKLLGTDLLLVSVVSRLFKPCGNVDLTVISARVNRATLRAINSQQQANASCLNKVARYYFIRYYSPAKPRYKAIAAVVVAAAVAPMITTARNWRNRN